jgi:nitrite reductase/ring-hydroxylating ferredoxin subunit
LLIAANSSALFSEITDIMLKLSFTTCIFLLTAIWGMLFVSCKKDEDTIPNVSVNIVISTTDPSYNDLNAVGGWIYLTGGSRGIIIYRYSIDEFMAYDRHCTYEPTESCAVVEVDLSGIIAEDLCCGSQFLLTDGSVIDGPASVPLKFYQTTFDGNNLYVYN